MVFDATFNNISVIEAIKNGQSRENGNIGTQDEEKQNNTTTQYVLDTTICKETQIT